MIDRRGLYVPEGILLLTVVALLALAEGEWLYLAITTVAVPLGWWTTVRRNRPLIKPLASGLFIIAVFCLMVVEYFWLIAIPVVALSHFMILVCVCKLLQQRTLRDDAQILVLCFLLLVVAAIVSGTLLFPLALAVFLGVGVEAVMRFHLCLEAARVQAQDPRLVPPVTSNQVTAPARLGGLRRITFLTSMSGVAIGVVIFLAAPRVGAGMFGRIEGHSGGQAITGFASTLNFNTIGTIQESDRAVMRVVIEDPSGADNTDLHYFRGTVLDQYSSDFTPNRTWEWRRIGGRGYGGRRLLILQTDEGGEVPVLPQYHEEPAVTTIVQHYYLEPTDVNFLFTCYPAVELSFDVRSKETDEVRKWVEDQVYQIHPRMPNRGVRYTVRSPVNPAEVASLIDRELIEEEASQPRVLAPRPALPREAEVLALIREAAGEPVNLDDAATRKQFVRRIEEFLQSARFQYTLTPPPFPAGTEPVGDFLLNRRRGHCEYFASAMAVMCQLSGIPARLVSGYLGGDYNPVGSFYVVRQRHAHSWVEVHVPGEGWVRYDPTPSAGEIEERQDSMFAGLFRYFDYLQFQWASMVVTYDADARRELGQNFETWITRPARNQNTLVGAVIAFVRELFGWRLELNWQERLIYWVFSLLVVMLVVLVGYVLAVCGSWLVRHVGRMVADARAARRGPEAEFYDRYCRSLRSLGLARRKDQTPAEFAAELAARFPVLAGAPELIEAYYHVVFGQRPLPTTHRAGVEQFLAKISALERDQLVTPG